jgi:hypothetical protein
MGRLTAAVKNRADFFAPAGHVAVTQMAIDEQVQS